jgi:hypothetical protein
MCVPGISFGLIGRQSDTMLAVENHLLRERLGRLVKDLDNLAESWLNKAEALRDYVGEQDRVSQLRHDANELKEAILAYKPV